MEGFGGPSKKFTTDPVKISQQYLEYAAKKNEEAQSFMDFIMLLYILRMMNNSTSQISVMTSSQNKNSMLLSSDVYNFKSGSPVYNQSRKALEAIHRQSVSSLSNEFAMNANNFYGPAVSHYGVQNLGKQSSSKPMQETSRANQRHQAFKTTVEAALASKTMILSGQISDLCDKYKVDKSLPYIDLHTRLGVLSSQDKKDFSMFESFHKNNVALNKSEMGIRVKSYVANSSPDLFNILASDVKSPEAPSLDTKNVSNYVDEVLSSRSSEQSDAIARNMMSSDYSSALSKLNNLNSSFISSGSRVMRPSYQPT